MSRNIYNELSQENLVPRHKRSFTELGFQIKRALLNLEAEFTDPFYFINGHYNSCTNEFSTKNRELSNELHKKYNLLINILRKYNESSPLDQKLEAEEKVPASGLSSD